MQRIADAAYEGHEMGGYINLKGLSMGDNMYADVWLYSTAGEEGYARMRAMNGTDQREAVPSMTWADVAGDVTGLARVIVYEEMINPYATTLTTGVVADPEYAMIELFEGVVKEGIVNGKFGRLITRDGDNFIGYLSGVLGE